SKIMGSDKILLLRLKQDEIGEDAVYLLGLITVYKLVQTMLARSQTQLTERKPFAVYCDEFSYFATPDFARFFTEGRKFGVLTTVAHQNRSQLDSVNRHASLAVPNKIAFRLSS